MKRSLLVITFWIIVVSNVQGQFLENKLDVSFGAALNFPLSPSTKEGYSTMFGNYHFGHGVNANVSYRYKILNFGGYFQSITYSSGFKDPYEILFEPSSKLRILGVSVEGELWKFRKLDIGSSIILGAGKHVLSANRVTVYSEKEVNTGSSFTNNIWTTGAKLFCDWHVTNRSIVRLAGGLQYTSTSSPLYIDTQFYSAQLEFGVIMKMLRDKYFKYE